MHANSAQLHFRRQLHTHMKFRMARQKRDDCSQRATGLVVLLRESGCTGPYFGTPSPSWPASTCLAVGLALCGTASVTCTHIRTHTHRHTQSTLSPYQKRKAALFAQTVSCSNFRYEQLVFGPVRGIFTLLMSPERS